MVMLIDLHMSKIRLSKKLLYVTGMYSCIIKVRSAIHKQKEKYSFLRSPQGKLLRTIRYAQRSQGIQMRDKIIYFRVVVGQLKTVVPVILFNIKVCTYI